MEEKNVIEVSSEEGFLRFLRHLKDLLLPRVTSNTGRVQPLKELQPYSDKIDLS